MTVDDPLAAAFGFDERDLDENRDGRLTERQRVEIEARRRLRTRGRRVATIAFGVTVVVLWVVAAAVGGLSGDSSAPALALGAVTLVFLALAGGALVADRVRSRDLRDGVVSHASGEVRTEVVEIREQQMKVGDQYRVEIGDLRLLVGTADQLEAFEPGGRYRIHYVADPPAHHVLSAERG